MGRVVTIDGPAGVGKSTAARGLARRLGWFTLNSGAIYRAVAWNIGRLGLDASRQEDRRRAAEDLAAGIRLERTADGDTGLIVGTIRPGSDLHAPAIAETASLVARDRSVRSVLLPVQRATRRQGDLVAEGRDMGTVVFPDADVKFFLDADLSVRARRRHDELRDMGREARLEEILADIEDRDERDMKRSVSPLRPADDAVTVDTTALDREEVVSVLVGHLALRIPDLHETHEDT